MIAISQDAPGAASAVMSRKNARGVVAQPSRRSVRLCITESEAAKIGILDRWQAAWQRKAGRAAQKQAVSNRLQNVLKQLSELAQVEKWSQRKLAAKIGLPESTLRDLRKGQSAEPAAMIPKLESALARLTAN